MVSNSVPHSEFVIRTLTHEDWDSFNALEDVIWHPRGIVTVPLGKFLDWIDLYPKGFLGIFKGLRLLGYSYCVRTSFKEEYLSRGGIDMIAAGAYEHTRRLFVPEGNAWYGISFATYPQSIGTGYWLVEDLFRRAALEDVTHFFCTVRLPYMRSYFRDNGVDLITRNLARLYGTACTETLGGSIHSCLRQEGDVERLPNHPKKREPVLSLLIRRFGCQIFDVVPFEDFEDTESANYEAALWRKV